MKQPAVWGAIGVVSLVVGAAAGHSLGAAERDAAEAFEVRAAEEKAKRLEDRLIGLGQAPPSATSGPAEPAADLGGLANQAQQELAELKKQLADAQTKAQELADKADARAKEAMAKADARAKEAVARADQQAEAARAQLQATHRKTLAEKDRALAQAQEESRKLQEEVRKLREEVRKLRATVEAIQKTKGLFGG